MADYERYEQAAAELMLSWRDWPGDEPAPDSFVEVCDAYDIAEADRHWVRSALAELVAEAEERLEGL